MNKKVGILGINLSLMNFDESIQFIKKRIKLKKGTVVYCCTLNEVKMVNEDKNFEYLFNKADLITPDGMPLVWGIRLKTGKGERVYGPELMEEILSMDFCKYVFVGDKKNMSFFKKIGDYIVMPMKDKFSVEDYNELFIKLNMSKGQLVWLGLGSKKQVEVAYEMKKRGLNKVIVTVGAAFDFISGNKKQAPRWLRNLGGEWLFRLFTEPRRLGGRYLKIMKFLGKSVYKKVIN
ncbi:MAG TPA: WecB/TagA/CpsF family glycosyltransferase [Candidatus Methanoperedens sp.]|nr:WecB/TagA/CpsF family glycosyltransferase [Candidatus Methanoperedens sp.]